MGSARHSLEPAGSNRLAPAAGGKERPLPRPRRHRSATWAGDSRHLMGGSPDPSVSSTKACVPFDGGTLVDTRVLQRVRPVFVSSHRRAPGGDSISFCAGGKGVHVGRHAVAPGTLNPRSPEFDDRCAAMSFFFFFPVTGRNVCVLGPSDTNLGPSPSTRAAGTLRPGAV